MAIAKKLVLLVAEGREVADDVRMIHSREPRGLLPQRHDADARLLDFHELDGVDAAVVRVFHLVRRAEGALTQERLLLVRVIRVVRVVHESLLRRAFVREQLLDPCINLVETHHLRRGRGVGAFRGRRRHCYVQILRIPLDLYGRTTTLDSGFGTLDGALERAV